MTNQDQKKLARTIMTTKTTDKTNWVFAEVNVGDEVVYLSNSLGRTTRYFCPVVAVTAQYLDVVIVGTKPRRFRRDTGRPQGEHYGTQIRFSTAEDHEIDTRQMKLDALDNSLTKSSQRLRFDINRDSEVKHNLRVLLLKLQKDIQAVLDLPMSKTE